MECFTHKQGLKIIVTLSLYCRCTNYLANCFSAVKTNSGCTFLLRQKLLLTISNFIFLQNIVNISPNFPPCTYCSQAQKKDKDKRKGKGRRFCFLAPLAVLPRTILNNRLNCTRMILLLKIALGKICSQHGKELNKFFTPNRSDDLSLFYCLYPSSSSMYLGYQIQLKRNSPLPGRGGGAPNGYKYFNCQHMVVIAAL